jgi:hypothetical protein
VLRSFWLASQRNESDTVLCAGAVDRPIGHLAATPLDWCIKLSGGTKRGTGDGQQVAPLRMRRDVLGRTR